MRLDLEVAKQACASDQFAKLLVSSGPFNTIEDVISAARHVWWQKVVHFAAWPVFNGSML